MNPNLYETAAFYGAPLSVQPLRHYDLRLFVDLVLKGEDGRLKNILPLILAKQVEREQDVPQVFDQWTAQDSSFRICWGFTQLALRQIRENTWDQEDRDRWRQSSEEAGSLGIEPERALANLRRFLKITA